MSREGAAGPIVRSVFCLSRPWMQVEFYTITIDFYTITMEFHSSMEQFRSFQDLRGAIGTATVQPTSGSLRSVVIPSSMDFSTIHGPVEFGKLLEHKRRRKSAVSSKNTQSSS
jgi:hypothetical protein